MQNINVNETFPANITPSTKTKQNKWIIYFLGLGLGFVVAALMHEFLQAQDTQIERWIFSFTTNDNFYIYNRITLMGESFLLVPISLLIILGWLLKKQWLLAAGMAMSVIGGGTLTLILKILFRSYRPNQINDLIVKMNYGFPSGHSVMSILFWGFLCYVLIKNIPNKKIRWIIGIGAALIPLVVGMTRLMLGVHYPTDILGGWMIGAMWLGLTISSLGFIDRFINRPDKAQKNQP